MSVALLPGAMHSLLKVDIMMMSMALTTSELEPGEPNFEFEHVQAHNVG